MSLRLSILLMISSIVMTPPKMLLAQESASPTIKTRPVVALIVGNDYYDRNLPYPTLHCSVHDAEAMKSMLEKRFGYSDENIIYVLGRVGSDGKPNLDTNLCTPEQAISRYGNKVTNKLLDNAIGKVYTRIQNRYARHVLLYFSGHGAATGGHNVFVCGDGSVWELASGAEELANAFTEHKAEKATMIGLFDVGRGGDLQKAAEAAFDNSSIGYFPLFACRSSEQPNENAVGTKYALSASHLDSETDREFKHSFFTYALLKSLDNSTTEEDLTVESVLKRASKFLSSLMHQADEMNQAAKTDGNPAPYSSSQTLKTLGRVPPDDQKLKVVGSFGR